MASEPKLTEIHLQTLRAWDDASEDFGFMSFDRIAARSGVERRRVRQIVRHLARKGLAVYGRGLWTEDLAPAGSGYAITAAGRIALDGAREGETR